MVHLILVLQSFSAPIAPCARRFNQRHHLAGSDKRSNAVLIYLLGAPEVAVIELSVGSGLVTVLFVFAFSITGETTLMKGPCCHVGWYGRWCWQWC